MHWLHVYTDQADHPDHLHHLQSQIRLLTPTKTGFLKRERTSPPELYALATRKSRPHSAQPLDLPAPYPPPLAFTRPLPDTCGLPDTNSIA